MRLTMPWAKPAERTEGPTTDVLVQASALTLARSRHIPAFLMAALRLRRTAQHCDGFAGLGLQADLKSRTFYTLSAWSDEESLHRFVVTDQHRRAMQQFGSKLADSHFVTWTVGPDEGPFPPSFKVAHHQLGTAAATT
jgi:heme-degrading monooxygenase HmoA